MTAPTFDSLFRRYSGTLQRFLIRRGATSDVAADLTQEAFLRLMRAAPPEGVRHQEAYLFRIAGNLSLDRHRREASSGTVPLSPGAGDLTRDPAPAAEEALLSREALEVLRRAIAELPPRGREIFRMHKFEGLSYAEIADRLGIAKNTVMVHMVRSLAHCKRRLDAYRQAGEPGGDR
ncbi:DNA-directed RNA polymerase sigma-70 factor [Allostella sp. ATCC 35155]|nr:DNA-directed RNA polymerase sigma-70 factor [Stella sp. ATCC 35155]